MPDIAGQAVAVDVGGPFEFGSVGVAGPDVAGLELLQLLLGAEFVCLSRKEVSREVGKEWDVGKKRTMMWREYAGAVTTRSECLGTSD